MSKKPLTEGTKPREDRGSKPNGTPGGGVKLPPGGSSTGRPKEDRK
jgi:hypothetical protein